MTVEPLTSERLRLEPLTVDHAAAMVAVLADPSIYEFTGGSPPTLSELTARYARQAVGHSPDGSEQWLNWVVAARLTTPVGYVQATVVGDGGGDRLGDLTRRTRAAAWPPRPPARWWSWLASAGVRLPRRPRPPRPRGVGPRLPSGSACGPRTSSRTARSAGSAPSSFLAEWQAWRDAREERLRDPHGWLSITAIHWLTPAPQRFDDVPGEWSGDERRATVTLAPGETLGAEGGATLAEGCTCSRPLDDIGLRLAFGDAVAQVAERDGRVIVRPRHPDSPNLLAYRGTPCYPADPAWVLPGRFEPVRPAL